MPTIVFIQETSGAVPQDHIRGTLYASALADEGVKTVYLGRQPAWVRTWSNPKPRWRRVAFALLKRTPLFDWLAALQTRRNERRILAASRTADWVHFIKGESTILPLIAEIRATSKCRIGYDLGDAIWLPEARSRFEKIHEILKTVDRVTTDNDFTKAYIERHNPDVFIWPSASQHEFMRLPARKSGRVIGWLGSPSTLFNLYLIWEALDAIGKRYPDVELWIVGSGANLSLLPRFESIRVRLFPEYDAARMYEWVPQFDIGLFPQFDTEENAGHGFTKAGIYMGANAVVVGSPVGVVPKIIRHSETGFLAASRQEWETCLGKLLEDRALMEAVAVRARRYAEENYSLAKEAKMLRSGFFES